VTVLAKYQRLEAEAIWRPDPEAQRRDVIVSIGDATLTISAPNGEILGHWSLPAILRLNPGETPALYAPGEDTPDVLELSDPEMTDGIEAVLKSIRRGPRHHGRVRAIGTGAVLLAVFAAALFWLPGAITRYTASLVPQAARADIGTRLRAEVRKLTGAPCADPAGLRALETLQRRLFPEGGTRLAVLPSALSETAHLPGGTILIGHKLVEDHESPEVPAGYILAEDLRRAVSDPLERVLADAGLAASLQLLTTGRLDDVALARHAERLVAGQPGPVPQAALIKRLKTADIAGGPYAYSIDFSGENTYSLIQTRASDTAEPLLGDGDWLALQRICER
jgi:hypothetical protein